MACDGTNGTPDLRNKFVIGAGTRTVPMNQGRLTPPNSNGHATFGPGEPLEVSVPVGDWLVEQGVGSPHDQFTQHAGSSSEQTNAFVENNPGCCRTPTTPGRP